MRTGPAPPPVESKKSLVSLSLPMLCCVVWCTWVCMCVAHTLKITEIFSCRCMYMSASLFLHIFSETKRSRTRSFHDVRFSKSLTFQNGFMFLASRSCFKHFSRLQVPLDMWNWCSLKSRKVLETATRSKKHETIVEGQRLRKADIPTTADRKGHTNRQTKSHSDAQDKQTHGHGHGHGHDATQHKTAEENKIDRETQKPL